MYLISLEMQGFKSFPEKTVLQFGKGVTTVVGPNGSGKSNIGDAVRWVLGEQSTKTLRGAKMEDVIFAGTELRKPVSFAAVTLNIANDDHVLNVDADVVSVTRKLYRNGDSEYLINGNIVRLKDIVELFMDTGLGRDGYSIIGQGRIADIVGSKSNERREIFEEAAGISKFRYKKAESERKLAHAEDNILRLKDILAELEGRVEPLRIQSEKAKKYLVLAGERKILEVSVWARKLSELKHTLIELEDKLLASKGEYEFLSNELSASEEELEQLALMRRQCTVAAEEQRERIERLNSENSNAAADIAVYKNNIMHYNSEIDDVEHKKGELSLVGTETEAKIAEKKELIASIEQKIKEISEETASLEAKLVTLTNEADEYSKSLAETGDELNKLYIKRSELKFTIENSKITASDCKENVEKATALISEANELKAAVEVEHKDVLDGISDINNQITEHNNKLNGFNMLYGKKSETLKSATAELNTAEYNMHGLTERLKMLQDLENSMEGFAGSVKSVISAGKSGRIRGVRGTVAQLISVESKYGVAIETALGGALQNIVVENEDSAKAGIRFLQETKGGRATFLPITSVKGNELYEKGLDMQEGFVSLASELVKFDGEYQGIILSLLGRIVVAENIDLATNIAKKYGYKFRIITLDGQVINAGGSFTGGSVSKSSGVLSRKNEIANLNNQIKSIETKNAILRDRVKSLSIEVEKLGYDVEGERELISVCEADKIRFEGEAKRIELVLGQYNDKIEGLKVAIEENEAKAKSAIEACNTSERELTACGIKIEELESVLSAASQRGDETKIQRETLSNSISDNRLKLVELGKDIEAANDAISQLLGGIEDSKNTALQYASKIAELQELIAKENENIAEREHELKNAEEAIEFANKRIREEIAKGMDYERRENELRAQERSKLERKEAVSAEVSRYTEKLEVVQRDNDNIISELWESYSLTVTEAEQSAEPIENMQEATKKLNEIKNKIRSLGAVNTDAVEEYKEVLERYNFLSSQLNDVLKAKSDLEKLIADLTHDMKAIFTESFENINENFKKTFVELFGGGKAELSLTDPDNILESGIEIKVAPPGKVIKNLSLLSGGEQSFVAIAIYFAILKLRPSPFCILDEIDAALDDVNVSRYAQYLRNFTETTQFILVTHRRGTMEESDVLYGVTMQEKGISKLLRMDVSEAVFAENN